MSIDLKKLSNSQLNELIQSAGKRKDELLTETIQNVRERVDQLLADEGLTFEQVFGNKRAGKGKTAKYKVKPKYRNPANPAELWSGRGLQPRWFAAAIASGKKEKDLLID